MEVLCYGLEEVGFQARVILNLWGMVFHTIVAFGLELDFLLDFISAYCVFLSHFSHQKNKKKMVRYF